MPQEPRPSRREFMRRGAVAVGTTAATLTLLGATARGQATRTLTAGLIGCGGRGKGAARDFLGAGEFLAQAGKPAGLRTQITHLADVYQDRLDTARQTFKEADIDIPAAQCIAGIDAYKKLMASPVDVVILATPPLFRAVHLEAAIRAGKHVFMEKPVAVDPLGCQKVMALGEAAKEKKLSIVAGTQRRHQKSYLGAYKLFKDENKIGRILGGCVWWCGNHLWYEKRKPEWSDRDYLLRNWQNFVQMSADHIVEQHVHNIDVANWLLGGPPKLAVGFGGRARRLTGNQFDFFSVDFTYGDRVHIHSMSRQIDGCWSREGEHFVAENGYTGSGRIRGRDYKRIKFSTKDVFGHDNPYVQEHVALVQSILEPPADGPLNEAQEVAESTLTGIMGRIAAYTGDAVRWSDVAKPDGRYADPKFKPTALDFETGNVTVPEEKPPLPGRAHT